jgi:hypothetical protein
MLHKKSEKKIIAFFLIFTLGTMALQINHFMGTVNAQSDNSWYVGKGVKPNTYYTYQIQNEDVNQGQPFTMTLYFKDHNDTGQYWNVPTFVVDRGQVFKGTLHLSDLDMTALGSSPIPQNMSKYRGGYATSLDWLSAYVPKPGQSLSSLYWGKIGSIGGSQIAPVGSAKVTTPAGTFDTTIIQYHKGVDNNIYIVKDMPLPVKALTYAESSAGTPPIQYSVELQATGTGQPPIPKSHLQPTVPPLTLTTPRGTYHVELLWTPTILKAGQGANFGVVITDQNNNLVPNSSYDFKVLDKDNKVVADLNNQPATDGTGKTTYKFPAPGLYHINVSVLTSTSSYETDLFSEFVTFDLTVT